MSLAGQVSALATAIANTLRDSYKPRLLPAGGAAGQVLVKNTAANYDAAWAAVPSTEIWRVLQADVAGANALGVQPVLPGAAAINLLASTTYELEVLANVIRTGGTTSHTTSLAFGGTATLTAINPIESTGNPTGNVLAGTSEIMARSAAAVPVTAANAIATEELRIWIRGMIVTNAAGTFIPQFSYSAAPGGVPTVKRGAFIRMKPLGPAALTALN